MMGPAKDSAIGSRGATAGAIVAFVVESKHWLYTFYEDGTCYGVTDHGSHLVDKFLWRWNSEENNLELAVANRSVYVSYDCWISVPRTEDGGKFLSAYQAYLGRLAAGEEP